MTTEPTLPEHEHHNHKMMYHGSSSSPVYGIGLVGAWVFYFKRATTFQEGVMAFLKGLVWPALLVYELLVHLEKE